MPVGIDSDEPPRPANAAAQPRSFLPSDEAAAPGFMLAMNPVTRQGPYRSAGNGNIWRPAETTPNQMHSAAIHPEDLPDPRLLE